MYDKDSYEGCVNTIVSMNACQTNKNNIPSNPTKHTYRKSSNYNNNYKIMAVDSIVPCSEFVPRTSTNNFRLDVVWAELSTGYLYRTEVRLIDRYQRSHIAWKACNTKR